MRRFVSSGRRCAAAKRLFVGLGHNRQQAVRGNWLWRPQLACSAFRAYTTAPEAPPPQPSQDPCPLVPEDRKDCAVQEKEGPTSNNNPPSGTTQSKGSNGAVVDAPATSSSVSNGSGADGDSGKGRYSFSLLSSWQQGLFASIGACMGVGLFLYVFWTPFKYDTVHTTADIASRTLSDHQLRENALVLSKEVVTNILRDPQYVTYLAQVLSRLLQQDESRIALTMFLKTVFEDHYTKEITKDFVIKVVADAWIKEQLLEIFKSLALDLLKDEAIKKALIDLLLNSTESALGDSELHRTTGKAMRKSVFSFFIPW